MPRPGVGNPGNKGGGRKSAFQEMRDARDTESMFFGDISQEQLEAKIRSGTFSIRDRYLLTAMEGDTKILESLSKKVLPDKIDLKGNLDISQVLDNLDGQETEGQSLAIEPPIQDKKQEGEASTVQTEQSTDPLPPEQVVS